MSFFHNLFSNFFSDSREDNSRYSEDKRHGYDNSSGSFWEPGDMQEDDIRNFGPSFDFHILTDPFEMQRHFEQSFNEILKIFVSSEKFPGFQDIFDQPNLPVLEDSKDLKQHYLKPGIRTPNGESVEGEQNKKTRPITSWLDSFTSPSLDGSTPSQPKIFSSFRSVIRKSVTLPDGTVKTEEIIQNSDGTESRTESQTFPEESISPFYNPSAFPFINTDPFNPNREPEAKRGNPKYNFLKPGYEQLRPNEEKSDKDLDREILQSGIDSLPPFTQDQRTTEEKPGISMRSFTRKIVTQRNGVIESEEVVRNADGSEQRTVTKTLPDGTMDSTSETSLSKTYSEGSGEPVLSFALKGVLDSINILFK